MRRRRRTSERTAEARIDRGWRVPAGSRARLRASRWHRAGHRRTPQWSQPRRPLVRRMRSLVRTGEADGPARRALVPRRRYPGRRP